MIDLKSELIRMIETLPENKILNVKKFIERELYQPKPYMKSSDLLNSELVGLWKDHDDIENSSLYARQLREKAQKRVL
ncbi:MAG: hypothetical protein ABRQ39_30780 [Candidatus Eremiobacterota bacterium]